MIYVGTKKIGEVESVDDTVNTITSVHIEAGVSQTDTVIDVEEPIDDSTYVTTINDDVHCSTGNMLPLYYSIDTV